MYADILLTLISIQLLILMIGMFKLISFVGRFDIEGLIRRAIRHGVRDLTSKDNLKRVETNTMPYIAKLIVVKVASALLIRYIGKKLR